MQEKLKELLKNAYSPYYHFRVACLVETNDGKFFAGVNVENANGTSICAERNAIAAAVAAGYKKGEFVKLHLMFENSKGTPCFACRQVLLEFMDLDSQIICYDENSNFITYSLRQLCPYPFGKDDLN